MSEPRPAPADRSAEEALRVAAQTLQTVIAQLRENGYADWPVMLERDVAPALSSTEALDVERLGELADAVLSTGALRHRLPHPENKTKCAACRLKAKAIVALESEAEP